MAGTVIGDLFVRLGVDMTTWNRDISSAESRLESFGTRLFFLGSRVTGGVTLPMLAAGAAIAKIGLDFDKAMTESLAIMQGVTPRIRAEMENVAKSVAATTKFSTKEAAEGYYSLASAGLDAATAMKVLPVAAQFAQAGVFDLAKATHYLASAQAAMATGMENSTEKAMQMQRVADVLTEANNRALGTVKDFAEALTNRGALALKQSNIELEAGVAILAAYAERGITGAKAGQQLWMMLRDLQTHALSNAKAFDRYNISVFTATGAMRPMSEIIAAMQVQFEKLTVAQRAQMLIDLGIPARSRAATQAIMGQADAIRAHEAALKEAGGTAKDVADKQMEALSNQFLRLKNMAEIAAIDIFKSFVPVIKDHMIPALESGIRMLKGMADFFASLPVPVRTAILAVAGLVAAIGPLTAMIGSMSLLASAAARGLGALAGGFGTLATAVGLASGGISFQRVALLQQSAATALAAGNMNKFNQAATQLTPLMQQLSQRQKDAWSTARMLALQQGATASEAMKAANAARTAERAYQAQALAAANAQASVGLLGRAWAIFTNPLGIAVGVLATVTAGMYEINRVTGNWRDTLLAAVTPGAGLITILTGLAERLGFNMGVMRDVGAIARDVFIIGFNKCKEAVKDFVAFSFGALDSLSDLIRDKLTASLKVLGTVLPGEIKAIIAGVIASLDKTGNIGDRIASSIHKVREALDRLAGTDTPRITNRDLFEPGMGTAGQGMGSAPPKPEGGFFPTPEDAQIKKIEQYYKAMSGKDAIDDMNATVAAMRRIIKEAKGVVTPEMADRMWDQFSKVLKDAPVKDVQRLIDEFGSIFETQFIQQNIQWAAEMQQSIAKMSEDMVDLYSDSAKKFMASADDAHVVLLKFANNPAMTTAFWNKHEGAIKELIPTYSSLPPKIQTLIRMYQEWKIAAGPSGEFREGAAEAIQALDDVLRDSGGKLKDLQNDIHQFSESAGETHRRTTRNKLNQIADDQEKAERKMLQGMARFTGAELDEYITRFNAFKANNERILTETERYEQLKYMRDIGVNAKIIRDHKRYTKEELDEIAKRQEAWNRFYREIAEGAAALQNVGNLASMLGLESLGTSLSRMGGAMGNFFKGMDEFRQATSIGGQISGGAQMAMATIDAFRALQETPGRGNRALSGAATGAMIGTAIMPGIGTAVGAAIGGIAGALMDDPAWEKMRKTVEKKWRVNVSEELGKAIQNTRKATGSQIIAMWRHFDDVIAENGGIEASSVNRWATQLAQVFKDASSGALPLSEAASALDDNFGALVQSGTTTTGMVSKQIVELVKLERQYKTGSKAIKEFVDAQLGMAAGGFNKVVDAFFGTMNRALDSAEAADTAMEKQNGLNQKAAKLAAQIADYEKDGVKNEKQRIALAIARVELARTSYQIQQEQAKQAAADAAISRLLGEQGQARFDQMGRLAGVMFDAAIASGKGLFEALEMIGPALDTLAAAQQSFGFESNEAFSSLMRLREFATVHPELVAAVTGLSEMMTGLYNAGFMTQTAFAELGAVVTETFNELITQGLTGEEAMQAMHGPLQRLWELQRQFGFAVDEATQKLIDEAVASGTVGEKFMSATDRMVLGIDKLVSRFDAFLRHLGIDIPAAANTAANAINDEFGKVNPVVHVGFTFDPMNPPIDATMPYERPPIEMAEGGIFRRPVVAGEAGPEAFIPLDRLFQELEAERKSGAMDQPIVVKSYLDGRLVSQSTIRHNNQNLRQHGLGKS